MAVSYCDTACCRVARGARQSQMSTSQHGACSTCTLAHGGPHGLQHMHLQVVLALVVEGEALGGALALVIAAALADGVHVAPVRLRLRVLQRVSVHLMAGDSISRQRLTS